ESIVKQIESLQRDLELQRKALLRVCINEAERYRCPHTGQIKTRKRTRVLSIDDSRLPESNRMKLAKIQAMYTSMIANLKRSLRDVLTSNDVRDTGKKTPKNKGEGTTAFDIERFLSTGVYDSGLGPSEDSESN